jgi:hypothetical protein
LASHEELSRVPPYRPGSPPERLATLPLPPDDGTVAATALELGAEVGVTGGGAPTLGVKVFLPGSLAGERKISPAEAFLLPLSPRTTAMTMATTTAMAANGSHLGRVRDCCSCG